MVKQKYVIEFPTTTEERITYIRENAQKYLPELLAAIEVAKSGGTPVFIPQDGFAANYSVSELVLLGMAIKIAGLHNVSVVIPKPSSLTTEQALKLERVFVENK